MATSKRKLITVFIITAILLHYVVEICASRRSTTRITNRSRTLNRRPISRSTLNSKYGSKMSMARSKISSFGWKKALLVGGLLYVGSRMYMSRRMYYSNPNRVPRICSNYVDIDENGTTYKMFICPRNFEDDRKISCCGPEGQQTCCAQVKSSGGVVGIVISTIIFVAIIGTVIYCVCRHKKRQRGEVISKEGEDQEVIFVPQPIVMPPPQPIPMGYGPPQPGMMPPPPPPHMMDPNQAQYPVNYGSTYGPPAGYPAYPPPQPGDHMPGPVPPPYAHPLPSAPTMQPGMIPPQQPPPPGFYAPPHGPPPSQPPPPYAMP